MDLEGLFRRFFTNWLSFGLMGIGALLINLAVGVVGIILVFVFLGPSFYSLATDYFSPVDMVQMFFSFAALFIILAVMGTLAAGLSTSGLMGSIAGFRQGEAVTLGTFWNHATRSFGRVIVLGLLVALVMIVSGVILLIPLLGWVVWFLWVPTASVVLGIYPVYLVVNEGYGPLEALGAGFKILTGQFPEALVSGLIMLMFSVVFGLICLIPLLGWLAVGLFAQPLVSYFFVERFEAVVRPKLVS